MTKILIIEDETTIREEMGDWLILEGYEVLTAKDGVEGIELAYQHQPDLIICDIAMPRLNGHSVLLELQSHPETVAIPFIFATARAEIEDIRHGMTLGADDYIIKPFTRLQLLESIQARLKRKANVEDEKNQQIEYLASALADEREQQQLKSRLVSMFAHDFRNPLAVILSSSNLLRQYGQQLSEENKTAKLLRIEGSVQRLQNLLDEMLLVAEMETGNLQFSPTLCNPTQLIEDVIESYKFIYGKTRQISISSTLDKEYLIDSRLVKQIVDNLLSNATKYSPVGSEILVTLSESHHTLQLTVRDHGIGIPEGDQPKLFKAFQRGSNVENIKGTGLGLAIVRHAVDLHNGEIRLESRPDLGTTFTIMLPVHTNPTELNSNSEY